jgi:hypothetical protein
MNIPQKTTLIAWINRAVTIQPDTWSECEDIYRMYLQWCRVNCRNHIADRRKWVREFRKIVQCKYTNGRFSGIAAAELCGQQ